VSSRPLAAKGKDSPSFGSVPIVSSVGGEYKESLKDDMGFAPPKGENFWEGIADISGSIISASNDTIVGSVSATL